MFSQRSSGFSSIGVDLKKKVPSFSETSKPKSLYNELLFTHDSPPINHSHNSNFNFFLHMSLIHISSIILTSDI
jgi:hypothetical protein